MREKMEMDREGGEGRRDVGSNSVKRRPRQRAASVGVRSDGVMVWQV